ncbi:MAG: dTMP kinase [Lentisphaeria bacterium]
MANLHIPAGGYFISLEGGEGAGKSTQAARLAARLRGAGAGVLEAREPGGTALGEAARRLVKQEWPAGLCAEAELFLMAACRAQLMRERILPHLAGGGVVLCDRFADSTTVYQGRGRGLEARTVAAVNALATAGRQPDLTLLLDVTAEAGLARASRRPAEAGGDRFEAETLAFHQAVREGYLAIARQEPERVRVVAAAGAPDEVEALLWAEVTRALG